MKYLFKRLFQMVFILWLLSIALFGLLSLMPGSPIDMLVMSNPNIRPQDVIRIKKLRGLDKPWPVQYVRWFWGYYDPVKPLELEKVEHIITDDASNAHVDLSGYLYDPNYFPDLPLAKDWLLEIWPNVEHEKIYTKLLTHLEHEENFEFLSILGEKNIFYQEEFLKKTRRKSLDFIKLKPIFSTKLDGLMLTKNLLEDHDDFWFMGENSLGQKTAFRIPLVINQNIKNNFILPIENLVAENEKKTFELDLTKYTARPAKFLLEKNSPGFIDEQGKYRVALSQLGFNPVMVLAIDDENNKINFAFNIEHGVIKNPKKFNHGFVFFFAGDKDALGFSQTYKRPIYDILFGAKKVCGNHHVEAGEMCDDGNANNSDGCLNNCYTTDARFIDKADAYVAGFIVNSGRIGNTIQLMLPAILLSLLLAIPLGLFSAYRHYSFYDYLINFMAFIGISLPVFWFGIMMIYLFSENLNLLPAGGVQTPGIYQEGAFFVFIDRLKYAILPTVVLSIFYIGRWLRYMRASMLEVLPKDYIRTARAKGLSEKKVVLKHALRNALIPVVTILALSIPSLFGGAVLTETVFSWPGIGRLQYDAVINNDYYLAIVVFLLEAMLVMVGNLIADVAYILVDPRIRKS